MAALCNHPDRCEVINLGWGPAGRGPFLVRQNGYIPGSGDLQPKAFILQRDGRWLLNLAFVMLPEPEQEGQLFHTLKDVLLCFEEMSSKPVLADDQLPPGTSPDEVIAHFQRCTHRILLGMKSGTIIPAVNEGTPG